MFTESFPMLCGETEPSKLLACEGVCGGTVCMFVCEGVCGVFWRFCLPFLQTLHFMCFVLQSISVSSLMQAEPECVPMHG